MEHESLSTRLRLYSLQHSGPEGEAGAAKGTPSAKGKGNGKKDNKTKNKAKGGGASPAATAAAKPKYRMAQVEEVPRRRREPRVRPCVSEQVDHYAKNEFLRCLFVSTPQDVVLPVSGEAIHPEDGKENILITSALPYVNNVPHLGNIIGCVLSADVYARWCRQRGKNAIYICGTDEYGTATETKALEEGMHPRAICTKYFEKHAKIYEWFDIDFDYFGRTSTDDPPNSAGKWPHTDIAQEIFHRNLEAGNLLEQKMQQLFCVGCDRFLADRFVEGICPKCGYEDARGDQCDGCGTLLNAVELLQPRCKRDPAHHVEVRETEHMFLDLPSLEPRLREWIDLSSRKGNWTANSVQITQGWLRDGLRPRCITRDLRWGTPVPLDRFSDKVFYVWFDAPIGYISITANYTDRWREWWMNPDNVRLVQFMGKDNIPFHTVMFPATLMGTRQPWTLLDHVSTTEYLNYEGGKFSKSRKVGVFGDNAQETGIPSEVWRYYLLATRPETSDAIFSWEDFKEKTNNELLKNLGNFVNRALKMVASNFDHVIPSVAAPPGPRETVLSERVTRLLGEYNDLMSGVNLRRGLYVAMRISDEGNLYLQEQMPWKLIKAGQVDETKTVVAHAVSLVRLLGAVLEPFMPGFADKVCYILDLPHTDIPDVFDLNTPVGHRIRPPQPLFSAMYDDKVAEMRQRYGGPQVLEGSPEATSATATAAPGGGAHAPAAAGKGKGKGKGGKRAGASATGSKTGRSPLSRLSLRVGRIVRAWVHPEAERLFCEEIDIGEEEPRLIASGLRDHYEANELEGRKVVVVANIKPKAMRGFNSHGMVLCATGESKVEFVDPPADAPVGTRVTAPGHDDEADEEFNLMKKRNNAWKDAVGDLTVNSDGVASYGSLPLRTAEGVCTVPSVRDAPLS